MNNWIREGLEGRSFRLTLRLYLLGLIALAPIGGIFALTLGAEAAFSAAPVLAVLLVMGQYAFAETKSPQSRRHETTGSIEAKAGPRKHRDETDSTDVMLQACSNFVHEFVAAAASTRAPVLIEASNSTAIETLVNSIHKTSSRGEYPLVSVSCAAIPEQLFESELFGYEMSTLNPSLPRKGLIELADHGTLFLSDIGHMPLESQAKLISVLTEQKFRRLGGTEDISVDVRVIASTNRPLDIGRRFREDLYANLMSLALNNLERYPGYLAQLLEFTREVEDVPTRARRVLSELRRNLIRDRH
jgi:transcriptional regulator with PAS, ATPase and Fis domain